MQKDILDSWITGGEFTEDEQKEFDSFCKQKDIIINAVTKLEFKSMNITNDKLHHSIIECDKIIFFLKNQIIKSTYFKTSLAEVLNLSTELYLEKSLEIALNCKTLLESKLKYLRKPLSPVIQLPESEISAVKKKPKQPTAKILMEFIRQIEDQTKIVPKLNECRDNDEKFRILAERIKEKFGYEFSGRTLEKEQYKQEGYSTSVFNLLKEWNYNAIATKYNAIHNK